MSVGVAIAGGKTGNTTRQVDDWYPTPPEVTQALLERVAFRGGIHEPCCGDGAMARVMEAGGYKVTATDLVDRGYGEGGVDILQMRKLRAQNIVTNPPFKILKEIIEQVMPLQPAKVALLVKSQFWHASSRYDLFYKYRPSRVIALTWRPDFLGLGRPTMDVSWLVWERDYKGPTRYDLARRPEAAR